MEECAKRRHLLLISYYFAPQNLIAAVRTTKIAKYFVRSGWNVTIITADKCRLGNQRDSTLVCDEMKYMKIIRVKDSNNIIPHLLQRSSFIDEIFRNQGTVEWYWEAKRVLKSHLIKEKFDLVISSYAPMYTHLLAAYAKKMQPSICWIADFRDAYINNITKRNKSNVSSKVCFIMQNYIVRKADRITTVSDGLRKELMRQNRYIKNKMLTITNGYDEEDRRIINDDTNNNSIFTIAYTGTIYHRHSDPSMLFQALKELISEGKIESTKVRFDYCGKDTKGINFLAKHYGIESIMNYYGVVNRKKSMEIQSSSQLLLALAWNKKDSTGILTGKIFEYMLIQKPVISITVGDRPRGELSKLIRRSNLGIACEEKNYKDDLQKLKSFISKNYNEFYEKGEIAFFPDNNILKRYEYAEITSRFIKLYEECFKHKY